MLELLRALARRGDRLRKSVKALDTPQVRRKADRDEAGSIVDAYFRDLREQLRIAGLSSDDIRSLDEAMHALLEASRKLGAKGTYEALLKAVPADLLTAE